MSAPATLNVNDLRIVEGSDEAVPRMQDLRLAERLGFKQTRDIRKLIERYRTELERYGKLICATVAQIGPGRPSQEFWLNEAQAILICMRSDTEQAADVREEVIKVFMAWRHGILVPANQTPMTAELLQDLFAPLAKDVGHIKTSINEIKYRIAGKGKEFPKDTQHIYRCVVQRYYAGCCPCGCGTQIMNEGDQISGTYTIDHYKGRNHVAITDGWPLAILCNQRHYNDAKFKDAKRDYFITFQKTVERYLNEKTQQSENIKILDHYRKPTQLKLFE